MLEAGGANHAPFQFLAPADESNPQAADFARQWLGDRQAGKEVSPGAAAGKNEVTCSFHCSFNPAKPSKAQRAAAIQKRTTILFSGQPRNWKWWCSGAQRSSRRRRHL